MARNDGIDRTSARNVDVPDKDIGNTQKHNEREKDSYRNPDIVPERTPLNIHFKAPTASYTEMFRQMEQDKIISTRGLKPDAIHFGELIFDVNSAYFHNHGGYEFARQFYADAYKAAVEIVGGEQYILSAVMHADEINRAMSEALVPGSVSLPPPCGLCAGGGKADPLEQTLQGQVFGRHGEGDRHAGQPEQEMDVQARPRRRWKPGLAEKWKTRLEKVLQCAAR